MPFATGKSNRPTILLCNPHCSSTKSTLFPDFENKTKYTTEYNSVLYFIQHQHLVRWVHVCQTSYVSKAILRFLDWLHVSGRFTVHKLAIHIHIRKKRKHWNWSRRRRGQGKGQYSRHNGTFAFEGNQMHAQKKKPDSKDEAEEERVKAKDSAHAMMAFFPWRNQNGCTEEEEARQQRRSRGAKDQGAGQCGRHDGFFALEEIKMHAQKKKKQDSKRRRGFCHWRNPNACIAEEARQQRWSRRRRDQGRGHYLRHDGTFALEGIEGHDCQGIRWSGERNLQQDGLVVATPTMQQRPSEQDLAGFSRI